MKQILFLIVLISIIYFVLWGGTTNVLHRADINPQKIITDLASGMEENLLPEKDPSRTGFRYSNSTSYSRIKENVLMSYDANTCFALVDLVYSSGHPDSEALVYKYLEMFVMPEDIDRIVSLIISYKDRQTLRILSNLYKKYDVSKPKLLNILSEYHTPEVAKIIREATLSEDLELAQTAKELANTFGEKKWYKEGIKTNISNTGNGEGSSINIGVNKNHIGQQYHNGSDFENKMKEY